MQTKSSQCGPDRFSTNTCIISDLEWTTSGARNVSQPQISATIFFLKITPRLNKTKLNTEPNWGFNRGGNSSSQSLTLCHRSKKHDSERNSHPGRSTVTESARESHMKVLNSRSRKFSRHHVLSKKHDWIWNLSSFFSHPGSLTLCESAGESHIKMSKNLTQLELNYWTN